jgi:hypothetical protein
MSVQDLVLNYFFNFILPIFKIPPHLALILGNFVLLVCIKATPLNIKRGVFGNKTLSSYYQNLSFLM